MDNSFSKAYKIDLLPKLFNIPFYVKQHLSTLTGSEDHF
jgi:hypothetical protein